jgi:hypothetical protein
MTDDDSVVVPAVAAVEVAVAVVVAEVVVVAYIVEVEESKGDVRTSPSSALDCAVEAFRVEACPAWVHVVDLVTPDAFVSALKGALKVDAVTDAVEGVQKDILDLAAFHNYSVFPETEPASHKVDQAYLFAGVRMGQASLGDVPLPEKEPLGRGVLEAWVREACRGPPVVPAAERPFRRMGPSLFNRVPRKIA